MNKNVWLAQPNHMYGRNAFLPYSAGLLQAYAQQDPVVRENYDFLPIIFRREPIQDVISRMFAFPPDVLGLSCYIWNFEYNMALARAVRANFPDCLIVAGGPHIPTKDPNFHSSQAMLNVLVSHEGEDAFLKILKSRVMGDLKADTVTTMDGGRINILDNIPSPYLMGVFDGLMGVNPEIDFHASQETHRGCPYSCTFCDWGSSVMTKVRRFSQDRIYTDLQWMTHHKIDLVYNCDANYGLFPADLDVTKAMAGLKAEHGFPKKFRAAYAKNSNDNIFEHAKILHQAEMNKGVTLSFQSMDATTLEIVKRDNIKITDFKRLMDKYREAGIATYSELILGLPGESYDSFANGLDTMLDCGQHESVQVYVCEVLPNSEMNDREYKKIHGISTVRSPIPMFHGTPSDDPYQEHYELVTSTKTMPETDWMRAQMLAWAVQAFHCLGLTQAIAIAFKRLFNVKYRTFYERMLAQRSGPLGDVIKKASISFTELREGKPWGEYNPLFGDVTWPPEEAAFLRCAVNRADFYEAVKFQVTGMADFESKLIDDLWMYQQALTMSPNSVPYELVCNYDWKAFFAGAELKKERVAYSVLPTANYKGDMERFAREVVWYGRKGGSFKNKVEYTKL